MPPFAFPSHCSTWNKLKIWNILTIKNAHLKAIFGKRGRFRAKSHEIKVVGNAILKTFYFITFFPGMHPLAVNDIILSSPRALRFTRSFQPCGASKLSTFFFVIKSLN